MGISHFFLNAHAENVVKYSHNNGSVNQHNNSAGRVAFGKKYQRNGYPGQCGAYHRNHRSYAGNHHPESDIGYP